MANLGDMTTYVAKRLIDPSNTAVSTDDIHEALNDAVRYWKYRRFWFNEANDTATMTQDDPSFPYPDDFLVPALKDDGFAIEFAGIRYPLSKVSEGVYDGLFIANGQGLPRWYARTGSDEYQCYPIPDQNYTVRRHYLRDYVPLSDDADTNDFTDNAARLIQYWALGDLTDDIRQDSEQAAKFYTKAGDAFRQLLVMTNKANAAGKLTLHSNLLAGAY